MGAEASGLADPLTAADFRARKGGEPLVCITAYDAPQARLAERAGVDAILVGDSLGDTTLGYTRRVEVSVDDIVHHTAAVARATTRPLIIADLPFMSYVTVEDALRHSARCIQAGGAGAMKLEGGAEVAEITAGLVERGIPVMAHVGLTPQSLDALSGSKVRGANLSGAQRVVDGARAQADAGAFAIVLEYVPMRLAAAITERMPIPTIGIGAGPSCDGEIQVIYDLLGFHHGTPHRHTHVYAEIADQTEAALRAYTRDVRAKTFPTESHGFKMRRGVLDRLSFD
jgi:3-methyl-2-oxobutanoate hydroxymethyltransferase